MFIKSTSSIRSNSPQPITARRYSRLFKQTHPHPFHKFKHNHFTSNPPNPTLQFPMAVTQKPAAAASGDKNPKSTPSHPPYLIMIGEAISSLKDRSGSSQIAIAKHIESNHAAQLPQNFKKHLLIQLKKLVANEKLVKIKNSYKLAPIQKPLKSAVEKKPKEKKEATKMMKIVDIVSPARRLKKVETKIIKSPVKKAKSIKSPVKKAKSIKSPVRKKKAVAAKK